MYDHDNDDNDINVLVEKKASTGGKGGRPKGETFTNYIPFKCTDAQLLELDRLAQISNRDRSYVLRNFLNNKNAITIKAVENLTSKKTLNELGRQGKNLSTLFSKIGDDLNDDVKNLLVEMISLNKEVRLGLITKAASHDC